MGEFFKGWRRKAGVVTLLIACVFAAGWVRSNFGGYFLEIPRIPVAHTLIIHPIGLVWSTEKEIQGATNYLQFKWNGGWYHLNAEDAVWSSRPGIQEIWSWHSCGFHFEEGHIAIPKGGQLLVKTLVIPHWSTVVPLTLLSAWLLLGKPRSKNPATQQST